MRMYPEITEGATRNYQHIAAIIEECKFKIRSFSSQEAEGRAHAFYEISGKGNLGLFRNKEYLRRYYEISTPENEKPNVLKLAGKWKTETKKPEDFTIDVLL